MDKFINSTLVLVITANCTILRKLDIFSERRFYVAFFKLGILFYLLFLIIVVNLKEA